MQNKNLIARLSAAVLAVGLASLPLAANAQTWQERQEQQRRHQHSVQHQRQVYNHDLRHDRNVAIQRANRWHNQATHRPLVITRRPVIVNRRPVVVQTYRPEIIYRTPPPVVYRYSYYNNSPRWYPSTPPNEWRSIAGISGGVALLGLLTHDNTLTFAGTLGALYSLDQYNRDRYSTVPAYRLRYAYFSRPFIYRDGHRYDRVLVVQGGHRYYRFVRR